MVENVQVFRNVRDRCRDLSFHIFLYNMGLVHVLGHAIKKVDMAEMPANGIRVTCIHQILHHCCPVVVLLGDYHLVNVQNSNVLEPVS